MLETRAEGAVLVRPERDREEQPVVDRRSFLQERAQRPAERRQGGAASCHRAVRRLATGRELLSGRRRYLERRIHVLDAGRRA